MGTRRRKLVAVLAALVGGACYAGIVVVQHNTHYNDPHNPYWRLAGQSQITILRPSNPLYGPYDFECYDTSTPPPYSPANIEQIVAIAGIGAVDLDVRGYVPAGRTWGAYDLNKLQLNQAGVQGKVSELRVKEYLGSAGNPTYVHEIAGPFVVNQGLPAGAPLTVTTVSSPLGPGPAEGFNVARLQSDVHVTGNVTGSLWAHSVETGIQLAVDGAVSGRLLIGNPGCLGCGLHGTVHVVQNATLIEVNDGGSGSEGLLQVDGNVDQLNIRAYTGYPTVLKGQVDIHGNLSNLLVLGDVDSPDPNNPDPNAAIVVRGSLTGAARIEHHPPDNAGGNLRRHLEVWGNVASSSVSSPAIFVERELSGQIRLYGSLLDRPVTPDIHVGTMASANSAIVVDWDGFQPTDFWQTGAVVQVGQANYGGNTPAARIYEITCPKGDLNNSADPRDPNTWNPDFDDINALVVAITGQAEYEAAYPGLFASWLYHGDCNCEGAVNFDDIDAFTLRLTDPVTWHQIYHCELCPAGLMPASLPGDPISVATMYRNNLAPQLLPTFVAQVRQLVDHHAGTPRGTFWAAVLRYLE